MSSDGHYSYENNSFTCNVILNNNNTLIELNRGWETIPETILLNVVISAICILVFVIIRNEALSRKSQQLSRLRKGWIQFIYGHRDSQLQNTVSIDNNLGYVHDITHSDVILPPNLTMNRTEAIQNRIIYYDGDDDDNDDDEVTLITTDGSSLGRNNAGDEWRTRVNEVQNHAFDGDKKSKRKAGYDSGESRLKKSAESVTHYGSWIMNALFIKDNDILQRKGSDALQYLVFQRYIIYFLMLLTLICLVIVLPVNMQGNVVDSKSFGKTTINNLNSTSNLLWVHAILASLIIPIGVYMMHHFSRVIKADEKQVARRTLLIQRIPKKKRNKEDLIIYFHNNFPETVITGLQFVYDIRRLNHIEKEYANALNAKLYCHDYLTEYNERCEVRPYCMGQFGGICCCLPCCPKVDGIDYYREKEEDYELKIKTELDKILTDPTGSVFITFQTEKMAMDVYKFLRERQRTYGCCCNCFITGTGWIVSEFERNSRDPMETYQLQINYAPYPDDINWNDLSVDYKMVWLRRILVHFVLFILFFFFSTPAFLFKFLADLEYFTTIKAIDSGLAGINLPLTQFLSPLLLMLMTVILPAIVIFASELIPYKTISSLNHEIMWKVYLFLLMMVIILPSAGFMSMNAFMSSVINKNSSTSFHWECLFSVDSGAFFVNYVVQAAFLGNIMEFLRFSELALYFIYVIISRSHAECENAHQKILFDFSVGVRYPRFLLIFAIVVTYSLACPLIAPLGLIYMIFKHLVDRHNIYFVYSPSKINGRVHSTAVLFIHIALIMMQFQVFSFLLLRTGYTKVTAFSLFTLMIALLFFVGRFLFHWFRNINHHHHHPTYNATTRLTRTVQKHEYCTCTYFPPVFNQLVLHNVIKRDYFSNRFTRPVIKTDNGFNTSTDA